MYKVNLLIDQGSDFTTTFNVRDENGLLLNLTGFTAASQMRKHYSSNLAFDFTVSVNAAGSVTLSMPYTQTALIEEGRYVYDVELTSTVNVVSRPIGGQVKVIPEVTR